MPMTFKRFAKRLYNGRMARERSYRAMERIVKGFANHRRIQILDLLERTPELSVDEISERLQIGYENASDHIRKLAFAGLVMKRNEGREVRHKLTSRANHVLTFCKMLG